MKTAVSSRISRYTALFAVLLAGLAFVFGGPEVGVGAAIGGLVAILNWAFVRWVGERVVRGRVRSPGLLTFLLAIKLGLLGVVLLVLIVGLGVHPGGLALGLGSLVLGILVGAGVPPLHGRRLWALSGLRPRTRPRNTGVCLRSGPVGALAQGRKQGAHTPLCHSICEGARSRDPDPSSGRA